MRRIPTLIFCLTLFLSTFLVICSATQVTYDDRAIKINGQRKLILSGSIHYPRSTPGMWQDLIRKGKEGGLNTIETYVFWNVHEPVQGQYDFSGNLDLVRFLKTIQEEGLNAILRIGPYVCAEWTYGGFPVWLHNLPGIEMRTDNDVFKNEMEKFTTKIVDMMRSHKLFASQGGPIILAQIENEYGNIMSSFGIAGRNYLQWCANLAKSYEIGIPWIMCQQDDAPDPIISTCNGYYCDQWYPKSTKTPKVWTENWIGWFKGWGKADPHRPAEDIAFAIARFFQLGGSVHNYYMYHGGTNFGSTAGGPYISTSYDYDAPLDEYGNLNQPKWGHMKRLHEVLMSIEDELLYGSRQNQDLGNSRTVTIYSYQGKRICFFANVHGQDDQTFEFEGNSVVVPAWSVSILTEDCYTEVFNSAKVNSQTATMVKKQRPSEDEDEPYQLQWVWKPEHAEKLNIKGVLKGSTELSRTLLDQKRVTNGTSDYMWLVTSVNFNKSEPEWGGKDRKITLRLHTNGHVVHVFLNGRHIGYQYATDGHYEFDYEVEVKMKNGKNQIALVSAIVGYPNYGANFDKIRAGIHGPIKMVSVRRSGDPDESEQDLSNGNWTYKSGLHGVDLGLYKISGHHTNGWNSANRPNERPFIWYKTTFETPMGTDPVAVDLKGLGKGMIWVNGHYIGRYWPSFLAPVEGCDSTCDYRGNYGSSKCQTGCGKSSQRWYHVPRDMLRDDGENILVVFEEEGGSPDMVTIQTVTVGKICANAYEGNTLELSCQGDARIKEITFASFGLPTGTCGSFETSRCAAEQTRDVVEGKCLGEKRCSLEVSESTFGSLRCKAQEYRLAVEAVCG